MKLKYAPNCTAICFFWLFQKSLNIVFKWIATAASLIRAPELSLVENLKFSVYPNPTYRKITIKGPIKSSRLLQYCFLATNYNRKKESGLQLYWCRRFMRSGFYSRLNNFWRWVSHNLWKFNKKLLRTTPSRVMKITSIPPVGGIY